MCFFFTDNYVQTKIYKQRVINVYVDVKSYVIYVRWLRILLSIPNDIISLIERMYDLNSISNGIKINT